MATSNYSERILELMRNKGITKSELGERMHVLKQNVNVLLETNNIERLMAIAKAIGVSLNDIVGAEEDNSVKGCVVYKGGLYTINSKKDIESILEMIE